MGAEDGDAAGRDLGQIVDETRALGAQPLDHVAVVDDLVADIDRRSVFLDRALDDLDRALDSGAKSPRLSQDHPHVVSPLIATSAHYTHKPRPGQRKLNLGSGSDKSPRTDVAVMAARGQRKTILDRDLQTPRRWG